MQSFSLGLYFFFFVSFCQVNLSGLFEVLSILLEWTSDTHLQKMPTFQESPQGSLQEQNLDFPSALVHEKCSKVCLFDGKEGF